MDDESEDVVTGAPQADLGRRAVRGAGNMVGGQVLRMALQLLTVVVLSRLLSPKDYGLLAMVMVVIAFGEVFRDFGLSQAAVRAPTLTTSQRDALFFVNTGIGIAFGIVLVLVAPLIAVWFGQPELLPMSRVLSLVFVFNGLVAQYRADLTRSMRFRQLVVSDLSGQAAGLAVATGAALAGLGFWALAAQQLTIGAVTLVAAAVQCGWLPRRPLPGTRIRSMIRFGIGLSASQFLGYLSSNVDTIVIGTQMGAVNLGYYNRGYQLLTRSVNQLRSPSTSVAVPVLTRLASDQRRQDDFIVRGQAALGFTVIAGLAFVAAAAAPIIRIALGDGWDQVIPVLSWLAIAAMFDTTAYCCYWVYLVRGLTGKLVWYNLVALGIKATMVIIGSQWGITGVACAIAIANAVSWPLSIGWLAHLTHLPTRRLYLNALHIVLLGALVAAGTAAALWFLPAMPSLVGLVVAVLGGAVGYGMGMLVFPPIRREVIDLYRSVRIASRRPGRGNSRVISTKEDSDGGN